MGTRSLTKVIDNYTGKPITCMYRQYDGYPSGHGLDLLNWLKGSIVVNGYNNETPELSFNGIDCLAASMFVKFKEGIGNIYCYHPDAKDCGEEYLYTIYLENNKLKLKCEEVAWEEDEENSILFDDFIENITINEEN